MMPNRCACALMLTVASPIVAQDVDLPDPSGPHGIGTVVVDLIDRTREEAWTDRPGVGRRLVVQVWYPAVTSGSDGRAPLVVRGSGMRLSLEKFWSDMPSVRTAARMEVPPIAVEAGLPLVIFSHGMNSASFFYTALLQDLASHGYVVAAIDHSYWSIGEAFEDGEIVRFEESMIARDTLSSDQIDRMMREGIVTLALDQVFVVREILSPYPPAKLAPLASRIDPARVATLGHSMGGMASQMACRTWTDFRSCASLDGAVWNPVVTGLQPAPTGKPLLMVLSEQFFERSPEFASHYLRNWREPVVVLLPGSRHNSFTDIALLGDTPDRSRELHLRAGSLLRDFFDATLGGSQPDGWSPGASVRSEGIEVVDLGALAR